MANKQTAAERFEELAKRLIAVPKADVVEAEKKRPKRQRRKPEKQ
jgi:hypothetical protein